MTGIAANFGHLIGADEPHAKDKCAEQQRENQQKRR
jgi:hypothetical protein